MAFSHSQFEASRGVGDAGWRTSLHSSACDILPCIKHIPVNACTIGIILMPDTGNDRIWNMSCWILLRLVHFYGKGWTTKEQLLSINCYQLYHCTDGLFTHDTCSYQGEATESYQASVIYIFIFLVVYYRFFFIHARILFLSVITAVSLTIQCKPTTRG